MRWRPLVEGSATVAVIFRALGAASMRVRIVLAAVVRVRLSGGAWNRARMTVAAFVVTVAAAAAGAVTAALTKQLLFVKDTATLAHLLVLRLSHLRVPCHTHGALTLCLLHLRGSGCGTQMQDGCTRGHHLVIKVCRVLPTHRKSVHFPFLIILEMK
jgi:hypothetical protein